MRHIKILLLLLIATFWGCKDYLDLVPEKDILSIKSIFEKKGSALQFLGSVYQGVEYSSGSISDDPAMCGADEFVTNEFSRNSTYSNYRDTYVPAFKIAEGKRSVADPILGIWGERDAQLVNEFSDKYIGIRYCNTFIKNIDNVFNMTDAEKKRHKAEAKAAKAWYYLQLIKYYGPIVLIPENLPISSDIQATQIPRSPVDKCFDRVVQLFDEAIPHLFNFTDLSSDQKAFFNKEAAMSYKAKALLYQASPLFNGNDWYAGFTNRNGEQLFSTSYDETKWQKAAVALDEAIAYCEANGKQLVNGNTSETSEKQNKIRDIQNSVLAFELKNQELIFGTWSFQRIGYKMKLPKYTGPLESRESDNAYGNLNPTMRMVEAYYTENGLPLRYDKVWGYEQRYALSEENDMAYDGVVKLGAPVIQLHLKREPRFYANIAGHNMYWKRGTENIEMNPLKGQDYGVKENRLVSTSKQNLSGYWCKKFVSSDVIAKQPGTLNYYPAFPAMRLADLYLMQAEAWNEFSGPSQKVYDAINKIRERAGIPTLQEAWSNYSNSPDRISNKEGLRKVIQEERTIEFAFEGHRFWDLRRWKLAHTVHNEPLKGWNIFGTTNKSFYNNYEGPIVIWNKNKFRSPRDYFWPITSKEILVGNINQNLGW